MKILTKAHGEGDCEHLPILIRNIDTLSARINDSHMEGLKCYTAN